MYNGLLINLNKIMNNLKVIKYLFAGVTLGALIFLNLSQVALADVGDGDYGSTDWSYSEPDYGATDWSYSTPDYGSTDWSYSQPDYGSTDWSYSEPDYGATDWSYTEPNYYGDTCSYGCGYDSSDYGYGGYDNYGYGND